MWVVEGVKPPRGYAFVHGARKPHALASGPTNKDNP